MQIYLKVVTYLFVKIFLRLPVYVSLCVCVRKFVYAHVCTPLSVFIVRSFVIVIIVNLAEVISMF